MKSIVRIVAAALAAPAAAAVVCAPGASADGNGFLNELRATESQLPGKTAAEMVTAGYFTCGNLRRGALVPDEINAVEQRYGIPDGTAFVNAAITNLCPDFAGAPG
ncbi:DUF732 domain-containing protein [Mycobacterium bourgelatii]|uniref:DUF732 domain-containing protein n=1 Tax=Mycobacterium bourgelatii TaxID=1273442 RepID=A0A7I9YHX6_MYCBU|nr:DUF732 domain-containing protein [Mycobacterium bourgelatii]MCV6977968.1 DUF732 domain-containing protein [Mycobacterium bourgelatii]GFG88103.1 hypothetical protein MBOU_01450 [Mycobacterium bourgelatii]